MSGHSRWSQIKHKKESSDQKKGQLFSKLAKKISLAAREGVNPLVNHKLQAVMEEARRLNMPKENIDRAIKRAGKTSVAAFDRVIIQAMGPGSVAIIIEGITDNKNRTLAEIKNILLKNEAKMVAEGSLNWLFDKNWKPHNPVGVTSPPIGQKLDKLFAELDQHDDVANIYSNLK